MLINIIPTALHWASTILNMTYEAFQNTFRDHKFFHQSPQIPVSTFQCSFRGPFFPLPSCNTNAVEIDQQAEKLPSSIKQYTGFWLRNPVIKSEDRKVLESGNYLFPFVLEDLDIFKKQMRNMRVKTNFYISEIVLRLSLVLKFLKNWYLHSDLL